MALLPPDSTPRRRRDRTEDTAAARQRARMARDLGDEQGQAWAHEPRRKRGKFTAGTAVTLLVFAGLGAVPVFLSGSDGQLLEAGCERPAVAVGTARISAGRDFGWQAAGPEQGPYVVTLDAVAVTGPAAGPVTADTGRVLAGPIGLPGCRSAPAVATGPTTRGTHEVVLFRRTATGWERAAVASLIVS